MASNFTLRHAFKTRSFWRRKTSRPAIVVRSGFGLAAAGLLQYNEIKQHADAQFRCSQLPRPTKLSERL